MLQWQAINVMKMFHHVYQPQVASTFGPATYYLSIQHKGRQFQVKSNEACKEFNLLEVGLVNHSIGYQFLLTSVSLPDILSLLKSLKQD